MRQIKSLLFLTKLQWKDRVVTSSFSFGLTLQIAVLTASVWSLSAGPMEGLKLSVRAALFVGTNITLFAAVSALRNEFRFHTLAFVLLSRWSIVGVIFARAAVNSLIVLTALILPVSVLAYRYPQILSVHLVLLAVGFFVVLVSICLTSALIINGFGYPSSTLNWLNYLFVILGLDLLPGDVSSTVSRFFPGGWLLVMASSPGEVKPVLGLIIVSIAWTSMSFALFYRNVDRRIRQFLESGRMAV